MICSKYSRAKNNGVFSVCALPVVDFMVLIKLFFPPKSVEKGNQRIKGSLFPKHMVLSPVMLTMCPALISA